MASMKIKHINNNEEREISRHRWNSLPNKFLWQITDSGDPVVWFSVDPKTGKHKRQQILDRDHVERMISKNPDNYYYTELMKEEEIKQSILDLISEIKDPAVSKLSKQLDFDIDTCYYYCESMAEDGYIKLIDASSKDSREGLITLEPKGKVFLSKGGYDASSPLSSNNQSLQELLRRLLDGNGKMSLLLLETREFAKKSKDVEFLNYIDSELNGYNKELPEYRKIKGEIVGTVQDPYGNIQENDPIAVSELSEQVGIDLTVAYIPDGLGFIEENLEHLNSTKVNRPLTDKLFNSFNDIVQVAKPEMNLISAAHRFEKSALQYIPSKVREELVKGLQNLSERTTTVQLSNEGNSVTEQTQKISVFVIYAWENDEHNERVVSFVDFLRQHGYNASVDRMKSQEESAINFNKMMVAGLQNADKVIVVLSPSYKKRADTFQDGVGIEFQIILEEIKTKINKYIFVTFGTNSREEVVPTGIIGREILDLKKDQDETEFNVLYGKLQSKNVLQFSEVKEKTTEVKVKKISPFRL